MLLEANPSAISETTNDGNTALKLAKATATRGHPNFALIQALKAALPGHGGCAGAPMDAASIVPARVSSNDSAESEGPKTTTKRKAKRSNSKTPKKKKRVKIKQELPSPEAIETPAAADLLLHFSRTNNSAAENEPEIFSVHAFAEV